MSGSSWLCSVYCVVQCCRIDYGATYYACYITQAVSGRSRIRTLMWLGIHIEPEAHTGATDNAFVHKCHVFSWFWVLDYWRNSGVPGPLRDAISLPPCYRAPIAVLPDTSLKSPLLPELSFTVRQIKKVRWQTWGQFPLVQHLVIFNLDSSIVD